MGITDFAQAQLGDVVGLELPSVGDHVDQMAVIGAIESVKAASDLYSPLSGTVVAVNDAVDDDLQSINDAPYDKGWLIRVKPDNLGELDTLMTAHAYDEYTRDRGPEE